MGLSGSGRLSLGPTGPTGPTRIAGNMAQQATTNEGQFRFRSFVERYVIARAEHFAVGREKEDAWLATKDAESIYAHIARSSQKWRDPDPP